MDTLSGSQGDFSNSLLERILAASRERVELEILAEELAGKIVVGADVSTGTSDVGAIPLDANFPLGGLHTNVMHTNQWY